MSGNTKIAYYTNRIMKANTAREIFDIQTEAVEDDSGLVNGAEDFDFLLVCGRYRKIKLGIIEYMRHALTADI